MFVGVKCLALLSVVASSAAREFSNPVIDGEDNPDPGVLLYDGVYYAVTTSNSNASHPNKFPIHRSEDLQSWTTVGHVFGASNMPNWTRAGNEFWAPELHVVNGSFLVYFASRHTASKQMAVGVARSNDVLGPYLSNEEPLVLDLTTGNIDPTVLTDGDEKYLVWKEDSAVIWLRKLETDGLSFSSEEKQELMRVDLDWERGTVEGPWFVRRGEFFYLFYSGNGFCEDTYAVGVARSQNALGPYEKRGDPILVADDNFKGPGHCSVVLDVEDSGNYTMVYHAWRADQVCGDNHRLLMSSSVEWSEDDWPFVSKI